MEKLVELRRLMRSRGSLAAVGRKPDMNRARLPAMQALQAFHAVARTGSISKAARLLNVTHGAISHQVKTLEGFLDVRLVARAGRNIRLTDEGEKFAQRIAATLDELSAAVRQTTHGPAARELRVSVMSSFATRWLLPRVGRFISRYPDVDLHITATANDDFRPDEMEVAIYYGDGRWPGLVSELLWQDEFSPVCAPSLRPQVPKQPADLARHTLLRAHWEHWGPWFRAAGLDWPEPARGPVFNDSAHMLQAAAAGQGIALGRRSLSSDDLVRGILIEPFAIAVKAERPLYLVYPEGVDESKKLDAFRRWLLDEVAPQARLHHPAR
jgi:LysR family glycine cleavage system transcriptional activator